MSPASAEVIKTGLQPQVDAKEINTRQKEEHDKLMALDGHFQRINSVLTTLGDSSKLKKVGDFCKSVLQKWDEIKRADDQGGDFQAPSFHNPDIKRVQWMKDNQPLPEEPRSMAGHAAF